MHSNFRMYHEHTKYDEKYIFPVWQYLIIKKTNIDIEHSKN